MGRPLFFAPSLLAARDDRVGGVNWSTLIVIALVILGWAIVWLLLCAVGVVRHELRPLRGRRYDRRCTAAARLISGHSRSAASPRWRSSSSDTSAP